MEFNPTTANLLAAENLTVVQGGGKCASFTVQTRVLQVPVMEPQAYDILIPHEVGHALYTTPEFNAIFCVAKRVMRQYYNILEDVRVEKLIKRQYPGLRKTMANGYAYLNSLHYVVPAGVDVNSLNFIDRANIYYKAGSIFRINFTPLEFSWIERIGATETCDDVISLAHEIYSFAKEQEQKKQKQKKEEQAKQPEEDDSDDFNPNEGGEPPEEDEEEDSGEGEPKKKKSESKSKEDKKPEENNSASGGDETPDENEGDGEETPAPNGKDAKKPEEKKTEKTKADGKTPSEGDSTEEDTPQPKDKTGGKGPGSTNPFDDTPVPDELLESVTQDNINQGLENSAKTNIRVQNFSMETEFVDPVITPTEIIKAVNKRNHENMIGQFGNTKHDQLAWEIKQSADRYNKFMEGTTKVVNYMVKEFEMKKSAHRMRHARVSKTGRLDMNKIFSYQLKDDIFRNVTITADDKNHGMMFLVDWSGSMGSCIIDTLRQITALAMFCRKTHIPFKVMAFIDANDLRDSKDSKVVAYKSKIATTYPAGKFVTNMGVDTFLLELLNDTMNSREFTMMTKLFYCRSLYETYDMGGTPLNQALVYMHSFIPKFKAANHIEKMTFVVLTDGEGSRLECKSARSTIYSSTESIYVSWNMNDRMMVADPITKEVYNFSGGLTQTLLKMIESSSKCDVIGFFVCKTQDIGSAIKANYPMNNSTVNFNIKETAKSAFRKDGWFELTDSAYTKLYFVRQSSLTESNYESAYTEKMSAAQLAKEMMKTIETGVANKVLMGKIIGEFA